MPTDLIDWDERLRRLQASVPKGRVRVVRSRITPLLVRFCDRFCAAHLVLRILRVARWA